MLSSSEEVWEGKQRSKSSTYCNKTESAKNFTAFEVCEKWHSVWPWGIGVQMDCLSSQVKAKRHWLSLSNGILKNVPCRSITMKNLLLVGLDVSIWGLGIIGCWGITMLLSARKSWTTSVLGHCFLTGKIRTWQGLVQGVIGPEPCSPGFGLDALNGFLIGYCLILGRGFEVSIWTLMGGTL